MNFPQGWELVLILLVILVLFGAKRMPDAARGLGRSLRIFKAETRGLREDPAEKGFSDTTAHHADATPAQIEAAGPVQSGAHEAPATAEQRDPGAER